MRMMCKLQLTKRLSSQLTGEVEYLFVNTTSYDSGTRKIRSSV